MIGESSRDIRLQVKLTMDFKNSPAPITTETYMAAIVKNPQLRDLFKQVVLAPEYAGPENFLATTDDQGSLQIFQDRMFMNMPLRAVVALGGPQTLITDFITRANTLLRQ